MKGVIILNKFDKGTERLSSNLTRTEQGWKAVCHECDWDGNCWMNEGTGLKNAKQEAESHNENTIHSSGGNPATIEACYER